MIGAVIEFFKGLPPEFATALIAMIPVTELRVSVPVALEVFNLSVVSAIFWSVLGDMVPATIILVFIDDIAKWLSQRSALIKRWYDWMVARTTRKFSGKAAHYGFAVGLILFVGIPLPMTGTWSGALAAFLFGIPKRVAWLAIFAGATLAGVIVALASLGIVKIFF